MLDHLSQDLQVFAVDFHNAIIYKGVTIRSTATVRSLTGDAGGSVMSDFKDAFARGSPAFRVRFGRRIRAAMHTSVGLSGRLAP